MLALDDHEPVGLVVRGHRFSIAIGIGAEPSSATGFFGVIVAGWAAAKVTLPIRVLITPFVSHVVRKFWPKPPDDDVPDDEPFDEPPPAA